MTQLTLHNADAVHVTISDDAVTLRDSMIATASAINIVTDDWTADMARECLQSMKSFSNEVEKSRKLVKQPVLELGRKVDSIADAFSDIIKQHISRIQSLLNAYAAEQERKRAQAERERQAAIEAENKRLAEVARLEAEKQRAALAAQQAQSADDRIKAEIALVLIGKAEAVIPKPVAISTPTPELSSIPVKTEWRFEVVDMRALYAARPDLVELTIRTAATKDAIKSGLRDCPGLRIWSETVATVRAR